MSDPRPVVPFSPRPSRPHPERVERARSRKVADLVRVFKAAKAGEEPEEALERLIPRMRVDQNVDRPTPAELVYRVSLATHDIVFATPERARYVDSLYEAMNAKTWGEFKSRIPAEEWEALVESLDEEPSPKKPFASEGVPGFCDGDWPPWLQQEILQVLPPPLARKYVEAERSCINGIYYRIKQSDLPELFRELDERGIHAVHAPQLDFN